MMGGGEGGKDNGLTRDLRRRPGDDLRPPLSEKSFPVWRVVRKKKPVGRSGFFFFFFNFSVFMTRIYRRF